MPDLFPTDEAKRLFLEQLRDVRNTANDDLHLCDRISQIEEIALRGRVRALDELDAELRRVWQLDDASILAAQVLGKEAASHWMTRAQPGLNGQCPIDMTRTAEGEKAVIDLLRRIDDGVYT